MNNGTSISRKTGIYVGLYKKCETSDEKKEVLSAAKRKLNHQEMLRFWDEVSLWLGEKNLGNANYGDN